jgi:Gluconate 2-dehydrogenase subunit 3
MTDTELKSDLLPMDATTGEPRPPALQPGYYPGYNTLSQRQFWDAATREAVEQRVYEVPEIRFFTTGERALISAVCDRILPQDDRLPERRIPILNYIDERLFKNEISGYRFEDMPADTEAHRLGLKAIDATAQALYEQPFLEIGPLKQDVVLRSIHDGEKLAAAEIWARMSIERYWQLLVQDCVAAYYSHPWAWDEIGFGGPAYPRAYTRLEGGLPEPWEVDEQRYEWTAPATSISDRYEEAAAGSETSHHGQGGTH